MLVDSSFEKPHTGEETGTPGDEGDVNDTSEYRELC
jgi:hypothetical protein